ncbi:MAG: hypothetical protein QF535_14795, partial [Anaerolineales bacterium]|nr:hypothetical protein [Anaerolineales bacterium]
MHEKENAQPLNDVYASMQAHYGLEVRKHGSRFYIAGLNSQTKQEAQQLVDDKGIDVDISLSISRANLAKLYEETTSTTLDDSIRKEFFTTPEKTYKTTSEDHVQELSDALGDTTQIDVGKALEDTSILYNGRNFYQKGRNGSLAKTEALDIISNVIIGYQEESSYQSVDEAVEPTLSVVTAQDTPEVVRPARASATVTPSVVEPSAVGSQIEVVDTEASVTIQHDREYSEPIAPDLQAVSSMAVDKGYVPEAEVFQPVKLDAPARSPWYKALGTAAAVLVATLLPNYTPDADAARHFFKKSKTPTSLSTPSYSKSPKGSAITTSRRGSAISPSGSSRKGRGSAITYTAGPTRGTAISPSGSS